MGLKLEENMYGWVGFFSFGPHTPVTFLDKYPPGFGIRSLSQNNVWESALSSLITMNSHFDSCKLMMY